MGNVEDIDQFVADMTDTIFTDFYVTRMLEAALLYIVLYGLAKYVLLEKMLTGKKGNIYYAVTFCISIVSSVCMEDGFDQFLILFSLLLAMILGRKKHRWIPVILVFPWIGLADGLVLPFTKLPTKFMSNKPYMIAVYRTIIYSLIAIVVVCFLVFGKNWRKRFDDELVNRKLATWEFVLISIIGILLCGFDAIMDVPLKLLKFENVSTDISTTVTGVFGIWFSITCFVLDVTVITTVLIANRQAFYHDKVSDMQFNIIVMMAEIVENRDENTGGHIQRTAKYVEIIAKQLKREGKFKNILTDAYIKDMMVAAPLHDIGKIHVSDVILNKPGRLTDEEFQIMKTHAEEGKKLLSHAKEHLGDFSYLNVAVQMAGYHHEWWDGNKKGYPHNVKGEEIPLCARIMAVADVFDALTSRRCYKEPMPVEKAYEIIREERGTHFDETIVDAFFDASNHIEEALENFFASNIYDCVEEVS